MLEPTSHTFDDAQLQIYTLMQRDSYPRFMNSPAYKNMLKTVSELSVESQISVIPVKCPLPIFCLLAFLVQNMFKRTSAWVLAGILLLYRSVPEKRRSGLQVTGFKKKKKKVSNFLRAQHHKYCYRSAQKKMLQRITSAFRCF